MPPPALVQVLGGNPVTAISVFACLNAADPRALRRLHPAVMAAVAGVPWADTETPVHDVVRWRAALPGATGVRVAPLKMSYRDMLPQFEAALAGLTQLYFPVCWEMCSNWDDVLRRLPPSLRVLKLGRTHCLGEISDASLAHLTALETLDCNALQVAVGGHLPPTLQVLRMVHCNATTQRGGFQHLRALRSFMYIPAGVHLSDEVVRNLPPSLRALGMLDTSSLPPGTSLAHLTQLTECNVDNTGIDSATLASLPATIVKLNVTSCYKLSHGASFAHLTALRNLYASASGIGDASLASLPPSLTSLNVKFCGGFTPAAVFPPLPALQVLDVGYTAIGDAAVASMSASLTDLRMTNCRHVTTAATLDHLPALRELHSWSTNLSQAAIMACHARGCATSVEVGALPIPERALALAPLADGRLAFMDASWGSRLHVWEAGPEGEPIVVATLVVLAWVHWRQCPTVAEWRSPGATALRCGT